MTRPSFTSDLLQAAIDVMEAEANVDERRSKKNISALNLCRERLDSLTTPNKLIGLCYAFGAARNKALEEAALKCDEFARQNYVQSVKLVKRGDVEGYDILDTAKRESEALASVIRALKSKEEVEI